MGAMVTFYKTVPQVVFWQWINQSFNALVNYTNRNADSDVSVGRLGAAYVSATASALGVAIGLNKYLERSAPPIFRRFVPLLAVAAANCVRSCGDVVAISGEISGVFRFQVNIPLMRQTELASGVDLRDEMGNRVCKSKHAARKGIGQVDSSGGQIKVNESLLHPTYYVSSPPGCVFAQRHNGPGHGSRTARHELPRAEAVVCPCHIPPCAISGICGIIISKDNSVLSTVVCNIQGFYAGFNPGNGDKLSYSQASGLA